MSAAIGWLLDPYAFDFMRRALLELLIVSVVGGVVGAFVVHKGLAFSGDALAHSTLAGIAIAFVSGASINLGALVAAVVVALGIGFAHRRARVAYDTAIGVFFVAAFSLGVLVISTRRSYTPDLFSFIFGDILGVSRADIVGTIVLAVVVLAFIAAYYRELLMVAYDPAMAEAAGVPVAFFQYALLVIVAVAVVVALQAIGIVLVNAMLLVPAATASLFRRRIGPIMRWAAVIGMVCSVGGLHLSYYAGTATSPAIVLLASVLFAAVLLVSGRRQPPALDPAAL